MSLQIALAQIQLPPNYGTSAEYDQPRCITSKQDIRKEAVRLLSHSKKLVSYSDLIVDLDVSTQKLRGVILPLIENGAIERVLIDGAVYLRLVRELTPAEIETPKVVTSRNEQESQKSRDKIIAAIKAGHDRILSIQLHTKLCQATISKQTLAMREAGVIKAVKIPKTNHVRLEVAA
jgi:hypothetical protein